MSTQSRALTLAGRRAPPLPIVGAFRNWSVGKTLVAPAVIYAVIVTQLPFVLTVWYSLLRWNLLRPDNLQFAGIDNYLFVVTADPVFWSALVNTIILTVGSVILALVVGLIYAELVNHRYPGRGIVRTMFITPFLIMPVVSALTWKNMMLNQVELGSVGRDVCGDLVADLVFGQHQEIEGDARMGRLEIALELFKGLHLRVADHSDADGAGCRTTAP
jgi:hypothetical protein